MFRAERGGNKYLHWAVSDGPCVALKKRQVFAAKLRAIICSRQESSYGLGSWGEKSLAKAATQLMSGSDEPSSGGKAIPATLVSTGVSARNSSPEVGRSLGQRLCDVSGEVRSRSAPQSKRDGHLAQDLVVDRHGFADGYQSVRWFVRLQRGACSQEVRVVIETEPGEECQVDYGVLTLGYSHKRFACWCSDLSAQVWAELHQQAFRRLDVATRIVVLDNLREGIQAEI